MKVLIKSPNLSLSVTVIFNESSFFIVTSFKKASCLCGRHAYLTNSSCIATAIDSLNFLITIRNIPANIVSQCSTCENYYSDFDDAIKTPCMFSCYFIL